MIRLRRRRDKQRVDPGASERDGADEPGRTRADDRDFGGENLCVTCHPNRTVSVLYAVKTANGYKLRAICNLTCKLAAWIPIYLPILARLRAMWQPSPFTSSLLAARRAPSSLSTLRRTANGR
jgi:hypothetical protein